MLSIQELLPILMQHSMWSQRYFEYVIPVDILILSTLLKKKDRPLTVLVEFKSAKFLTFRCESSRGQSLLKLFFFSYKHKLLSCLAFSLEAVNYAYYCKLLALCWSAVIWSQSSFDVVFWYNLINHAHVSISKICFKWANIFVFATNKRKL